MPQRAVPQVSWRAFFCPLLRNVFVGGGGVGVSRISMSHESRDGNPTWSLSFRPEALGDPGCSTRVFLRTRLGPTCFSALRESCKQPFGRRVVVVSTDLAIPNLPKLKSTAENKQEGNMSSDAAIDSLYNQQGNTNW